MIKVGDILKRGEPPTVTEWEVLDIGPDGRVFCRSSNKNTAWLRTDFEPEGQVTPEDHPVCICHDRTGFVVDQDSGLYVHKACGKPTAIHLAHMAARAGAGSW